MKKNIFIFGITLGIVQIIPIIIMTNMMYSNTDFKSNDILGYASLVVINSLIFFGIRNYRNKVFDGIISFGNAFKTGLYIVLAASTVYVIIWLFYYYFFIPDFMEVYTDHVLNQCTTENELAEKKVAMENYNKMYENPLFVVLLTYAEVLPIGLVVALISAFILKKKK